MSNALTFYRVDQYNQIIYKAKDFDEPIVLNNDGPHSLGYFQTEEKAIEEINSVAIIDNDYKHEISYIKDPEKHIPKLTDEVEGYEGHFKVYTCDTARDDLKIMYVITRIEVGGAE